MGATADGWWRDKPAAARRLAGRLACHQDRSGDTVVLVLDVPTDDLPDGINVHFPRRRGRDAADERILELLDGPYAGSPDTVVVTSDRALAAAARDRGAHVEGAGSFLAALDRSCNR